MSDYNSINYEKQGGADWVVGSGGTLAIKSGGALDVESGGALKLAGTQINTSAAELNLNDQETQLLVADGAITIKNGICVIAKTVAGVVNATLADPVATTDDFKRLTILNGQAQANVVTSASSFGGGGGGEDVCTFSATIGDSLALVAYSGKWYIIGNHQATIA